jgi:Lipid A core - O-antigen ligase and related enzymes
MITVIFSTQPLLSLKYLLAKTWYIGAFVLAPLLIFRTKKPMIIAALSLISAMMLVVLISLYRHNAMGFRFASVNEAIIPFFRNHVNYSAMLVALLPVMVACLKLSTTRTQKMIAAACIAIALAALFFAYARGAWLALLAGIVAVWLLKKKLLFATYLLVILVVFGSLFWIKAGDRYLQYAPDFKTTIFHKDFNEHLVATYQLKDVSTAERFYRWIAGIRMIKDKALTGYGPNTFYDNYKPYAVPAYKTWVSDNKDHSTVHNYFLLVAIEQGIPGLILFLLLLGALFYYAQRTYHRSTDIFYELSP